MNLRRTRQSIPLGFLHDGCAQSVKQQLKICIRMHLHICRQNTSRNVRFVNPDSIFMQGQYMRRRNTGAHKECIRDRTYTEAFISVRLETVKALCALLDDGALYGGNGSHLQRNTREAQTECHKEHLIITRTMFPSINLTQTQLRRHRHSFRNGT